jgi:ABC-2 type transport system ATP-binding protein
MDAISINGLTKYYGKSRGIQDISFSVKEGEIYGFMGPNGAGKSTTIKVLLNMIFPTGGEASILGMDCVRDTVAIKRICGYVPSDVRLYPQMKVRQLIDYSCSFYSRRDEPYIKELLERFEMDPHKRFSQLSLGNRKKAAILAALCNRPRLLILDEPTNGLDPLMQDQLFEVLQEANRQGVTVFFSSHQLHEIAELCHRAAMIKGGSIADVITLSDLALHSQVKVTLSGENVTRELLAALGAQNLQETGGVYTFIYGGGADALIKALADCTITQLLIQEVPLSDIFRSYYEKGGAV